MQGQDRTDGSMRVPALVVATLANFLTPFHKNGYLLVKEDESCNAFFVYKL